MVQPLYIYFLSFVNVDFALSLAQTIKAVDKIHFEVNAGPSRHPMSARQLLETLRRLSKVFGYPFNVIISAPALVFYPFKFSCCQSVLTGSHPTSTSVLWFSLQWQRISKQPSWHRNGSMLNMLHREWPKICFIAHIHIKCFSSAYDSWSHITKKKGQCLVDSYIAPVPLSHYI